MVSEEVVAVLAYGHILSAFVWLGGGILTGFVIGPSLRKMAPAAALEFNAKVLPKILRAIQVAVGTTFLFGLLLLYFFQGGDLSFLMNSTQGYILSAGIAVAAFTAVLAVAVTIPSFKQISKISQTAIESKQPPSQDMARYGKRAMYGSMAVVFLLLFVLATMVASGFLF